MRFSPTHFATLVLSLALVLTTACQKSKLPTAAGPDNKSQESLDACEQLNLARDASWTASFLRKFVSCASIQKDQKGTLDHTLKLIDEMGPEQLQKALDLMLATPANMAVQNPSIYPNLNAVITLMDRGTHDGMGLSLAGTEKRWDTLQSRLASVRPRLLLQWMMALEEADALDAFVTELVAWNDAMPKGSLAGLAHIVLTNDTIRKDLVQLQNVTIDDPEVYPRLKKLWDVPHDGSKSFIVRAQEFWNAANVETQKRWAHVAGAFLRMGLETQIDELIRRTHDLYDLARSYALRQAHFFTDLRELLDQGLATQLSDLEPAMKGLNQIKDTSNYRDAFEEKAGSTYLHELVEDFIWEGPQLQSCTQAFPGMKTQAGLNDPRAILSTLLTPQASCQGRVPLLLYLDETLGLNCQTGVCARGWVPTTPTAVAAADLQKLSRFAWIALERELRADPFRLKNRQLAYGPIEGATLDQLKTWWEQHIPATVEQLVEFDHALTTDARFEALLKKDFLESWYGLTLQKLNTIADEFRDVWPDQKNPEGWYQKAVDVKMLRTGLGLYAFGPLDQSFSRLLPTAETYQRLNAELPDVIDAANLSQILSPIREVASQIKNYNVSIKPETEVYSGEWPGSQLLHLGYKADGRVEMQVGPYALDRLMAEGNDGWAMLTRYRDQLPLLTAAADPARAKALENWIQSTYLPLWASAVKEDFGYAVDPLPVELFEGGAIGPEDARLFTLFAAQSWLGVQPRLPSGTRINSLPETTTKPNRDHAPQSFLGLPGLVGSKQAWTAFWAFNSGLFAADKTSLQSFLQALPQEAAVKAGVMDPQPLTYGVLNVVDQDKITGPQRVLLQLQATSSLGSGRTQQLVPSLGFAKFCPSEQGKVTDSDCPFMVDSYATWRRFLETRVLDQFCPFISGNQFSASFQNEWRAALGLQDTPAQIAQLCAGSPALTAGSIPNRLWEQNWLTLLHLGRNPQLKGGLQQLPEAIRRLKIRAVSGDYQKFVRFNELAPLWMPVANARLLHREGVYAAFRWHAPGLIDHVIAAYNQQMGDKDFTDRLKKLGRLSNDGGNPVFNLIQTITAQFDASKAAGETPIAFVLAVADRISKDPALIQTTSRLLEKPEDPYAGILLAYTFPQAMKVGVFENFAWDHPSYKLMRLAFKSENRRLLLGLVAAFDRLAPKLWKIYQDAASVYSDRSTMAQETERLLRFAAQSLAIADAKGQLSVDVQDLLRKAVTDDSFASFIRIVHQMREPLVDLQNKWQAPLMDNLDQALHSSISGLLRMGPWLQKLPEGQGFDLMVRAWRGMSGAILHEDGREMWGLMQDRRLGLGDDGIIISQLRDPALRADVRQVLRAAWALKSEWILAALDEIEELAISTQKTLHYFQEHVQWRGTGAATYRYFIKTMDQHLENGHKLLQDELNLLRDWVDPEKDIAVCNGGNIAC